MSGVSRVWRTMIGTALVVAGCGGDPARPDPYRIEIDVGPQIRAFGEETLTADEAGDVLVQIGPAVVPALAAALEREPKDVRVKAVEVLATIASPDAVPALVRAASRDADDDVRGDAVRALGAIGDPRGAPVVEAALDDPRLAIRAGGVMACARLCRRPEAITRLADVAVHDADRSVALAATASLVALRELDAATRDAVRAAVAARRPEALPAGATPDQRALAAVLASDLDPDGSAALLVDALPAASPPLQRQLAWRLGRTGDARAAVALRSLLGSGDARVRAYAYDALVKLRERGVDAAGVALAGYAGPRPAGPLSAPEF